MNHLFNPEVRRRKRTVCSQLLNGLRITGTILAVFAVIGLVLHAENIIRGALDQRSAFDLSRGVAELAVATLCLFLTARTWARYLAALTFIGAAKAIVFGVVFGVHAGPPLTSVPRLEATIVATYLLLGGILTVRFATHKPAKGEIAALVLFVLATAGQVLFGTWIPGLVVGISGLLIARLWPTPHKQLVSKRPSVSSIN